MGRPKKSGRIQTLKRARVARHVEEPRSISCNVAFINGETVINVMTDSESEIEVTRWTGGVSHEQSDNSDFSWEEMSSDPEDSDISDEEASYDSEEDTVRLQRSMEHELRLLMELTPYKTIMKSHTSKEWKKAESKRGFGYTGRSDRRRRELEQRAREKAVSDEKLRKS